MRTRLGMKCKELIVPHKALAKLIYQSTLHYLIFIKYCQGVKGFAFSTKSPCFSLLHLTNSKHTWYIYSMNCLGHWLHYSRCCLRDRWSRRILTSLIRLQLAMCWISSLYPNLHSLAIFQSCFSIFQELYFHEIDFWK